MVGGKGSEAAELMQSAYIDVWDAATFDEELLGILNSKSDLVRAYVQRDTEIFIAHDSGRRPRTSTVRPENSFAPDFCRFTESLTRMMQSRTVRAWHYTRLLDSEVEHLKVAGVHLSTLDSLRDKLDACVSAKLLSREQSDQLFAGSRIHDLTESRSGKFWMNSHPIPIDDGGVDKLMSHWGGEVVTFGKLDADVLDLLAGMGRARVLEVAVPLSVAQCFGSVGKAVVAGFCPTIGVSWGKHGFDLYSTVPLSGESVLETHTEGEGDFERIGQGYPDHFIDPSESHWKALGMCD